MTPCLEVETSCSSSLSSESNKQKLKSAWHHPSHPSSGHLSLPGTRPRHAHPGRRAPAVALDHVRRDEPPRLQPGQPLADGPDARDRFPRGRRHRLSGEHGAAHGAGREGVRSRDQQREGDQLHDPLDDDLAGGRLHPARLHVRTRRADLPRVRDHDRRRGPGVGHRVADPDPAHVRAPAPGPRPGFEEDLDGAGHRRGGEAGPRVVRPGTLVVPGAAVDLDGDLGGLSRRDDLPLLQDPEDFSADRGLERRDRRLPRKRGFLTPADARDPERRGRGPAPGSERSHGLHDDRRHRFFAGQHGADVHVSQTAEGARSDPAGRGAADGQDQLGAGRDGVSPSISGSPDLDGRHEPEPGAVRLRRVRRQSRPGLRDGRQAHGQVPRVPGFPFGLLRLLREHAEPGHRAPARPGEDVRGLGGADPDPAPELLFAELSVSDQEAAGPIPGDPRGPGLRARGARGPLASLHQVG